VQTFIKRMTEATAAGEQVDDTYSPFQDLDDLRNALAHYASPAGEEQLHQI